MYHGTRVEVPRVSDAGPLGSSRRYSETPGYDLPETNPCTERSNFMDTVVQHTLGSLFVKRIAHALSLILLLAARDKSRPLPPHRYRPSLRHPLPPPRRRWSKDAPQLAAVRFANAQTGWALGPDVFLRTTNGGKD